MCSRDRCWHSVLFHVLGFLEGDRHCMFPGCECPAYAPEVTA